MSQPTNTKANVLDWAHTFIAYYGSHLVAKDVSEHGKIVITGVMILDKDDLCKLVGIIHCNFYVVGTEIEIDYCD